MKIFFRLTVLIVTILSASCADMNLNSSSSVPSIETNAQVLRIYYYRYDGNYGRNWGLHLWGSSFSPISWTNYPCFPGPETPSIYSQTTGANPITYSNGFTNLGGKLFSWIELYIPESQSLSGLSFLVHHGEWKDLGESDQVWPEPAVNRSIFCVMGKKAVYTALGDALTAISNRVLPSAAVSNTGTLLFYTPDTTGTTNLYMQCANAVYSLYPGIFGVAPMTASVFLTESADDIYKSLNGIGWSTGTASNFAYVTGGLPRPLGNSVVIKSSYEPQVLNHELAHSYIELFGRDAFRRAKWLDEGLAEYLAWESYHTLAGTDIEYTNKRAYYWNTFRDMVNGGGVFRLSALSTDEQFGSLWATSSNAQIYTESFIVVTYLINRMGGMGQIKQMLALCALGATATNAAQIVYGYNEDEIMTMITNASFDQVFNPAVTAAAPAVSLPAGLYDGNQAVTFTSGTPGAYFRYTLDDTDPNDSVSALTGSGFTLNRSVTLKVITCAPGYSNSSVVTVSYTNRRVMAAGGYKSGSIYYPAFWDNGVPVPLTGLTNSATVKAMGLSGSSILLAGSFTSNSQPWACVWLDGQFSVKLSLPAGALKSEATGLYCESGNVYISGYYQESGGNHIACYWKNGVRYDLPNTVSGNGDSALAITASGGDVYVAGFNYGGNGGGFMKWQACTWRDAGGDGLSITHTVLSAGSSNIDKAMAVTVSGGVVYTAGIVHNGSRYVGTWWSNTAAYNLGTTTGDDYLTGIARSGGNTLICGQYTDTRKMAAVWENGTVSNLPGGTSGTDYASAIVLSGGDIFVSGNYYSSRPRACYWKNGVRYELPAGTDDWASAIMIYQ